MVQLVGGAPFAQPPVVDSKDGVLDVVLDLSPAEFEAAAQRPASGKEQAQQEELRFRLTTRAFNGSLPGPTLRILPGDTLRLLYRNRMPLPTAMEAPCVKPASNASEGWPAYSYCQAETSNLHWHGAHASEALASDDTRLLVTPGTSFQYETRFAEDHMPGTVYVHPHVHGSSALQVSGGAASVLLVRDPPGFLPRELAEVSDGPRDLLWVVQRFQLTTLLATAATSKDGLTRARLASKAKGGRADAEKVLSAADLKSEDLSGLNDFVLVNGVFQPALRLEEGLWYRWRLLYANGLAGALDFAVGADAAADAAARPCEVMLLAKDGVYLRDFPRPLQGPARVPPGGRADVLVRCWRSGSRGGRVNITAVDGRVIATAEVQGRKAPAASEDAREAGGFSAWSPRWPRYLQDTQHVDPTPGCSCLTVMGGCPLHGNCMNGRPFDPGYMLHTTRPNAVVERRIMGLESHPYHQHMYPFQLIDGFPVSEYHRPGDWHDTWLDLSLPKNASATGMTARMRYRTTPTVTGRMMVHCHRLGHEDLGMMAVELVAEDEETPCSCDAFVPPSLGGPSVTAPGALRASLALDPGGTSAEVRTLVAVTLGAIMLAMTLLSGWCVARSSARRRERLCDCYARF